MRTRNRTVRRSLFRSLALGTGAALALTGAVALPAHAAPGDSSNATGQYLAGTLLGLDATLVASLGGAAATSDGTSTVTDGPDDLDVGVLSLVNLSVPGGINLPVTFADVGVVGQYAQARADGSSTGASGLITDSGGIGVAGTDGPQPGPLRLNLGEVVDSLTGLGALADQLAGLNLTIEATAATATQAAPTGPVGDYEVAGADLSFTSPVLAGLTGAINTQVGNVQTTLNALAGPDGSVAGSLLGALSVLSLGVLNADVSLGSTDLPAAVAPLLTGSLTSPEYPGVAIDLSTGEVHVDLEQIVPLNDLPPNTNILTHAFDHDNDPGTPNVTALDRIQQSITGLVGSLLTQVEAALTTATNNVALTASVNLLASPVLTIDSTIGALLAGDTSGVSLLGLAIGLPGGVSAIVSALASPLSAVTTVIDGVSTAVLAPVLSDVVPAIGPVLNAVVTLTVNNQATAGGVFTETALRATLLPGTQALTLDVANASVGPNAVVPAISSLTPTEGPTTGGTVVTITGTGFTGATGVTFDGTAGTSFTVDSDTQITVTTPAGTAGPADVVITSPSGDSQPGEFTYVAAPVISSIDPTSGPTTGGTTVTITGTGFTGASAVTFDGLAAASFTVNSDTTITATTPAHPIGPVPVVVTTAGGASNAGTFTYTATPAVPVISSLVPDEGPETGGTSVTITGTGFTGATGVTFDGASGTALTVVSDTEITVVTPAHAPGAVDVVVTTLGGTSAPGEFTYTAVAAPPAISSITPNTGPETGGTVVTITGTGFTDATGVTFDGTPGTSFTVDSDTQITVTTPPGTAGVADVVVLSPNGDSTPGEFTYLALPTISSLTPDEGPEAGGTSVTITGTGFTGATGVDFGGTVAASFTVDSDTQITAVTPAHAPGAVDVTVTAPGGTSAPGEFTFLAAASITSLTPDEGPVAGGTVVTITGTGFTGATGVTFDGTAGTAFSVDSDTQITVTTPAGTAGAADVVVESPNGDSDPGTFTYLAAPAISGLTPDEGPVAGGTVVTITGTGFTGATGVTFDGTPGTSFTVVSDTEITVTTPAGTAGVADVIVLSPNGDSAPGEFTYLAAPAVPTITGLTPTEGPETGGTSVTITGTGFTGATSVTFDGTAATSFTVDSDTQITAVTPAHAPGAVDVVVTTLGGTSAPGEFTYTAVPDAPAITSITPNTGPETGGTVVTITGTGFTGATGVTFDGTPGTSFTVVSDTEITVTTPPGTAGVADVVIESPNGDSAPGEFTYTAVPDAPAITGLTPTSGPVAGGTVVTITGTGFTGATGVTFDGTAGTAFTVDSDTQITVTTPAGTAGPADVVVLSPNGDSAPGEFTYVAGPAVPVISSLTPTSGPTAGGTTVTITGSGFTGATAVQFDGIAATSFTVDSDTQITAVTPAHAAGPVDVTVMTLGGTSAPGTFTYVAPDAPVISGIAPDSGPVAGGTVVTITGTGFTDATGVTFDGTPGTSFTVVSDTEITVTTPPGTAGTADVVIQSPNGDSGPGVFTYVGAPVIDSITPDEGPIDGGTVVTIIGEDFTDATGVTFDGEPGTDFQVIDDNTIIVTTPPGTVGDADVIVQSPNGDSAPGVFTYVVAPTITSMDPTRGPTTGGTVVTIIGTGFLGNPSAGGVTLLATPTPGNPVVTFDGIAGTNVTVVSDTELRVTSPAHAVGTVPVVVMTTGGSSNPGDFTYYAAAATGGGDDLAVTGSDMAGMMLVGLFALLPLAAGIALLRRARRTAA